MRSVFLGIGFVLIAACSSTPSPTAAPSTGSATSAIPGGVFALLYQGNRAGVTEPCGCHTTPYGGLDREFNAVKQTRASFPSTLYVDAGNSLGPEKRTAALKTYQDKALAIVEMLNTASLQVLTPGPLDFALGLSFLKEAEKAAKFPFVNSSARDAAGNRLFASHAILETAGMKVAVLGISPEKKSGEWTAPAPEVALKAALKEVKGKADWIFVLSQISNAELEKLAIAFPEVQVFVGCDPKVILDEPFLINKGKSLLVDGRDYGYRIGRLELVAKLPFKGFYSPEAISNASAQLADWEKMVAQKRRVTEAKMRIERLKSTQLFESVLGGTLYANKILGLNKVEYGEKNEVTDLLKKYQASLKAKALGK